MESGSLSWFPRIALSIGLIPEIVFPFAETFQLIPSAEYNNLFVPDAPRTHKTPLHEIAFACVVIRPDPLTELIQLSPS
jgi:hypothetical protein